MNKKNILIIDDETGARSSLRMIFKNNFNVLEASNAEEALKILEDTRPNVILLDIIMPHTSGIEVLKKIKMIDKRLPVIMISALRNKEMMEEALRLGAFSYMIKPFNVTELEGLVQKAMTRKPVSKEK